MVSTRNHPRNFPEPEASPTKSSASESSPVQVAIAPAQARKRRSAPNRRLRGWVHAPSHLTLLWLAVSLPLVIWDTGYVLGRPATMPGGWLHEPLWKPYALYGTIDYVYGWPAIEAGSGFTSAQGALNVAETLLYMAYLWVVGKNGRDDGRTEGRGASVKALGWAGQARIVGGSAAGAAVLLGFTASVMTLSKTVLYLFNEWFSGWQGVGHNDASTLFFLWIVPNGSWIILPTYMTYVFGAEILDGLAAAAGEESPIPRSSKDE